MHRLTEMDFFTFLGNRRLPNDPSKMTKAKMLAHWKEFKSLFEKYMVDEMAKSQGHEVLRLPPYHCMFNPIELLWAYQKREARSQSTIRSVKEATTMCQDVFKKIPGDNLNNYFRNVQEAEEKYWV